MFGPTIPQITVEDLKKVLEDKENAILLDVRTEDEYTRGKIKGSINIPLDELEEKVESIIPDKSENIYVYCLSGSRSAIAVEIIKNLGYKNVFDVKSGLLSWRMNQYPLE